MKKPTIGLRALFLSTIGFVALGSASGQVTWTKGQLWKGKPGTTETVAQIMRRPTEAPPGIREIKENEIEPIFRGLQQNPASPEVSRFPYGSSNSGGVTLSGPLFSVGSSWTGGVVSESGLIPPDSMGDASPTQVMMTVNGRIKIFDRAGNVGALNTTTDSFFGSVRSAGTSDPRCRFDRLTNRWFIVMVDVANSNNRILIAASNSATITGTSSFTFFEFNYASPLPGGSTSAFCDYPSLGIDANSVYIGGNIFNGGATRTDIFVINKSQLLTGTLTVSAFRSLGVSGNGAFGPWSPHGIDNDNPNATEGYILGSDINYYGTLDLRRVTYSGGVPSISSNLTVSGVPSTSGPLAVPAKGSSYPLDALDHRLFAAKMFYNRLTGVGTIWAAQDYGTNSTGVATSSPDRTGSRWYEVQGYATGQTPSLVQAGSLYDTAASSPLSYWIPSIAMNGQGYAALCCSIAGAPLNANIGFAQRASTDTLGTLSAPVMVTSSTSNYNIQSGGTQRWGDFSHTSLDPADGQSLWTFQEYCNANNSWGLQITHLLAPAPTVTQLNPSSAYPYDTVNVTVTGTGIFDPGATFPNRLSAGVSGSGVTVNNVTFQSPTQATVNLTVASNATAGGRTLTLTNPDGQSATATFTVNARAGAGTVTLQNWSATTNGVPVTIQIEDSGNNVVQTATANLDASGNYSFVPAVAPGTYTVFAKASHWLRRKATGVTISSAGFSGVNFSLINGDINGDNTISLADFGQLKLAYGSMPGDSNWNPNADLDGNGAVGLSDFGILKLHYGESGD